MADVGTAALQIIPSFQGFQGKLEQGSSGALVAAGSSGGRKYGDSAGRSMASRFSSHVKTAAIAGSAALATAGYALFKLGQDSLAEARESQKVGALTAQVIKTTGDAANVTAKQVGDLSTALSLKTGVDDEVIQRGANMILTFKDIRNEVGAGNDIFNQSVAITEDMAAAMAGGQGGGGLDLKSSAILVGKALNDPAKGLTALTRVGVSFTEQQKKQIGALVESGKTMEAQKLILHELQSEFGGAAEAQATMGEKASVAWGNIEEQLGTVLLPLVNKAEHYFLKKGVPAIEGWINAFEKKGVPALKHFYREAKPVAEDVLPAIGHVLGDVRDFAAEAAPHVRDLAKAFSNMPDWAQKAIVGGGLTAAVGAKFGAGGLIKGLVSRGGSGGGLLGEISAAKPLPVYVVNSMPGAGGPGGAPIPLGGAPAVPTLGTLPKWAPFIPVGLGSYRPPDPSKALPTPPNLAGPKYDLTDPKFVRGLDESQVQAFIDANIRARAEMKDTAALFKTLPKTLQTDLVVHGGPESRKEVMALVKQYDLTPKQKQTLFKTYGIPDNKATVQNYMKILGGVPKTKSTAFYLTGVEAALGQIATLNRGLDALAAHGDHVLPYVHGGTTSANTGGGSSPATGGASRGRGTTINVHLDGKVVGSVVDDRIGTYDDLAAERGRANR